MTYTVSGGALNSTQSNPTISRSDSELEVQRCAMNKNTFTVDPIMLEDEL